MKLTTILAFCGFALYVTTANAQVNTETIEDQFIDVIEKSNRYEDYKVVKIYKLNSLKKNVRDTIAAFEKNLETAHGAILQQKEEITNLTQNLSNLQDELTVSMGKEDGISLFGSLIKKSTYKATMWAIIGLLVLLVLFLFYRFKNSNTITRNANHKLIDTEAEFEDYRQKNLEQQQILRRKLQDEINKNKKI